MVTDLTISTDSGLGGGVEARPHLIVVRSPDTSLVDRRIDVDAWLVLGRRATAPDVRINDPRMSRSHARLKAGRIPGSLQLDDDGSKNGTYVNGLPIHRHFVVPGDVIRVGDTLLVVDDGPEEDHRVVKGDDWLCRSRLGRASFDEARRAATSQLSVLLLGPTGCGKDILAREIHRSSRRRGQFVAINCGALADGVAESQLFGHKRGAFTGAVRDHDGFLSASSDGTLFLDELAELSPSGQVLLLRVLEEKTVTPVGSSAARPVDLRIVAATNADLGAAVQDGRFRADLYARLAEWPLQVSPLGARRLDVPVLFDHFVGDGAFADCAADAAEALLVHDWPLNIRELRSVARRATIERGDRSQIVLQDLPVGLRQRIVDRSAPAAPELAAYRRPDESDFRKQFERHDGNVAALARHYRRDRRQIYRWLDRFGLPR